MSEDFEAPPMSGDNLPIKELEPQKEIPEEKEKVEEEKLKTTLFRDKRRLYPVVGGVIFLVFLMGLGIGILLKNKKPQPEEILPTPEPTIEPSPVATSSSWQQDLEDKIGKFENDLKNVDLKESQFLPPILDFEVRFELED